MSAHRRLGPRGGTNRYGRADDTGPRRPSGRTRRGHPALSRCRKAIIGASIAIIAVATGIIVVSTGIKAVPRLTSATTTTSTIRQVGAATAFESGQATTVVTKVPAGTAAGDVLLTFVETHQHSRVTCASGARLILSRSHGAGTRLAGCLSVAGRSVPAAVRIRISPRGAVAAVTMAFAGVDQSTPVDAVATASSSTSPSVTVSSNDLVVFGLGSSGRAAVATAPSGAQLQATVNNSAHAQVAAATRSRQRGTVAEGKWSLKPSSLPAAATVALLAAPVTVPSPASASPTATSPAPASPTATSPSDPAPTAAPSGSPATSSPASASAPSSTPTPIPAPSGPASTTAPASPPVTWCESGLPTSPDTSAPAGSVTVPAGNNSSVNFSTPDTTYWFAPGSHTLGTSAYTQIQPADGDTYVGAPGAVLDGQNVNQSAFVGNYKDLADENVTIEYLTIENFRPNQAAGAVNSNGNNGWTEKYDLMKDNSPGAAMMLGGDNVVSDNCLTGNGEYGFNGYSYVDETFGSTFTGGATNITFTNNDVSDNNTQKTQSGIEGGGKFWQDGDVVVTGNYVHNNIDSPGLWMDTDNAGFLVQGNYISGNDGEGLMYEISYNADIVDNTFVDNAIPAGARNAGFPTGAIYISESGGNASVPSTYAGQLTIQNNVFQDNWSGVVVYQNANRHSGDGQDPGTLTPPSGTSVDTWIKQAVSVCPSNLSETSPTDYNSLCQWRAQNVTVQDNTFEFNPSDSVYAGQCTGASSCGQNGIFSVYSSTSAYPTWSVCNAIANNQDNHFQNNTYTGPWKFMYFNQGDTEGSSAWQAGVHNVEDSGDNFVGQDGGSTFTS
jgi:hypothetical protein